MKIYFILMALMSLPAFANNQVPDFNQEVKSQWKLLGPAFSKHASLNGAPVLKQGTFAKNCFITTIDEMYYPEPTCVTTFEDTDRKWSETNPAPSAHHFDATA